MSDNVTFLDMDDDDDKTIFQSEEERKKIETEISETEDDDITVTEVTHQMTVPNRPYWQQVFG